jgi:cellulose synthase/poly-beta-1,6-N-acetylglucosamine synthase-like glycosyltransferase
LESVLKIASVAIGICATTEVTNTLSLTDQMLSQQYTGMVLTDVIVATPNTHLAKRLEERHPQVVVLSERTREGKAAALNKILESTSAEILVLASADIRLDGNTISRLVSGLSANEDWGAVDSRVELANTSEILMDRVSRVLWDVHNTSLDQLDRSGRLGHVAGDLLAVRRRLVDKIPRVINDDAYIALRIQEKGYLIKRVQDAYVWIIGPRTPTDYILQRSRILAGHLQLIRRFGKVPTTFEFQVLSRPRRNLRTLVGGIAKRGPSGLLTIFVAGVLEILSFQVAIASLLTGRAARPWTLVHTTKNSATTTSVPEGQVG